MIELPFSSNDIVHLVTHLQGKAWASGVFFVVYFLFALVWPFVIFPIIGGVLFGLGKGFFLNLLVNNLAAWLSFALARSNGRQYVIRKFGRYLEKFDEFLSTAGFFSVLMMRLLTVPPFVVVNYGLGLTRLPFRVFALASFLGMLPWAFVLTYFSDRLWSVYVTSGMAGLKELVSSQRLEILLVLLLIVAWGIERFRKRPRSTSQEAL